jgi:hypothetical protein
MIRDGGIDLKARIDAGMRRTVARHATDAEQGILRSILEAAADRFGSDLAKAQSFITTGSTPPDGAIDPVELAPWTVVASTLLNLDETISKR